MSYRRRPSRQRAVRKLSNIIGNVRKEPGDMENRVDEVHCNIPGYIPYITVSREPI